MIKLTKYPSPDQWEELLARPYSDNAPLMASVKEIIAAVQAKGDTALRHYTAQFDGIELADFQVGRAELEQAGNLLTDELKAAIQQAKQNIEAFHRSQHKSEDAVETMPGVLCWRENRAINKVGLYIPGGTAPLFSTVLMLAIPAALAGCAEIILCSPCNAKGTIHPAILYCAQLAGVHKVYKIGGAQAIAAMAYGTQTVPAVYKIFGPGNQYVTAAKQLVQVAGIAIDMPAGPSEVCVLADAAANPAYVAADLLAQAEHGPDSQVVLVTTSESFVQSCLEEIEKQVIHLTRKDIALRALSNSRVILVKTMLEAVQITDQYAAEHLILHCENADEIAVQIKNAGSVFIGPYSPESIGDYASGTNHTLPTNGYARAYSGVSTDSFVKKITYQKLTKDGLNNIAKTVMVMAEEEGLQAHAAAVKIRLGNQ